jgi:hypothetical protein
MLSETSEKHEEIKTEIEAIGDIEMKDENNDNAEAEAEADIEIVVGSDNKEEKSDYIRETFVNKIL